jgi:hypothetical protein
MTIQAAQEHRTGFRDPTPLWHWMRALVIFTIVVYLTLSALYGVIWALYARLLTLTQSQAELVDAGVASATVAMMLFYYVSAFFTARVTYRAMKNLHAQGSPEATISPGWAIGWYFVPFASFFMPMRAVREIWRGSFALKGEIPSAAIIGWWWTLWLLSAIALSYVNLSARQQDPGIDIMVFTAVAYALRAVCALLLLGVFAPIVRIQSAPGSVADVFE